MNRVQMAAMAAGLAAVAGNATAQVETRPPITPYKPAFAGQTRAPEEKLAQAQERLAEHNVAVLVLSRLVPAGRLPVMLACLLADWPLRRSPPSAPGCSA